MFFDQVESHLFQIVSADQLCNHARLLARRTSIDWMSSASGPRTEYIFAAI
jgi:hypothetical protein